jgi:hypothetical protein
MAYLTTTILQQEASWWFTAWQPAIADTSAFTTWLGTMVSRVANHVKWRVGATLYGTSDTVVQGILQEAELCYAQYYLLMASAALADTSDDVTNVPASAGQQSRGRSLRDTAKEYKARMLEVLSPYDQSAQYAAPLPGADAGYSQPEAIPQFDATIDWGRSA